MWRSQLNSTRITIVHLAQISPIYVDLIHYINDSLLSQLRPALLTITENTVSFTTNDCHTTDETCHATTTCCHYEDLSKLRVRQLKFNIDHYCHAGQGRLAATTLIKHSLGWIYKHIFWSSHACHHLVFLTIELTLQWSTVDGSASFMNNWNLSTQQLFIIRWHQDVQTSAS